MGEIAYTVTARFPDTETRDRYVAWLRDGHVAAVVAAGAARGWVSVWDDDGPPSVEARYHFPSAEAYETYLDRHAPALRADGAARFGTGTGVEFERRSGPVLVELVANG